jgi:transposase-like protein
MASRYPGEERRVSYKCLICGRYFRRFRSQAIRGDGRFCTRACHRMSVRLYHLALSTGAFEEIMKGLAAILSEEKKAA